VDIDTRARKIVGVGANQDGQLADGTHVSTSSLVEVAVTANDLRDKVVIYADAGDQFTVCLTADGQVWSWATANDNGALGRAHPVSPVRSDTRNVYSSSDTVAFVHLPSPLHHNRCAFFKLTLFVFVSCVF
jgi:alpha-tubulin suppressor-like RCC1 family protein